MNTQKILILGVTASGKGNLAFRLAKDLGAEIISIDSMKVYKRMDIGTAKPNKNAQELVKYHLIDVIEPSESFSVGNFLQLANQTIEEIQQQNKPVIAVGGTALYIKAILHGLFDGPGGDEKIRKKLKKQAKTIGLDALYEKLKTLDPKAVEKIHSNDKKRIIRALEVYELTGQPISSFQTQFEDQPIDKNWTIIGLRREKQLESARINKRVKKMIELGLVDEVKSLLSEEKPLSKQARCAIGYAEIIDYLNNQTDLEQAVELIKKNSRHLAKHQRTWFKRFENVNWIDINEDNITDDILTKALQITRLN